MKLGLKLNMRVSIKQVMGSLMAAMILLGSLVLGNGQPAAALGLNPSFNGQSLNSSLGQNGLFVLANAGGKDLRNAVDDKLATEYGNKIDVNNTNIAAFRRYRGLYPTIAGKIVSNAPYDSVDDILRIPNLSEVERDRLQKNMDIFTISAPDPALVEGADRFNNGVYK